jgi:transcriptional regulator with XRE-family HTH domain
MARKTKAQRRVSMTATTRGVTAVDRLIGTRVRARRMEQHVSQQDLAAKIGVTFQQVQKYEKGVNRIGSARLVQIASFLEVDTSYFLANLNGTGNGGDKATASRFVEFLATKEGVEINEAMMKLPDAHRRGVIDLARSLVRAYGE